MISEKTKATNVGVGIRRIIAAILGLSLAFLLIDIFRIGIIPVAYLLIGVPLYIILNVTLIWSLLSKKTTRKRRVTVALCLVAALLPSVNLYGTYSIRSVNDLLSSVQKGSQMSYTEYVIVTLKDSGVALDNAETISVISSDPLFLKVTKAVEDETSAKQTVKSSLAAIKNGLLDKESQTAVIRKALLPIIQEADKTFYDSLVILKTLSIENDSASDQRAINITKPYVLYISGIDTGGSISTISRSDVNMLMVVNPTKRSILLVNTPRDYYVQLHGTTGLHDKLTHAGVYGVAMSINTLEDLYSVDIQQYVRINFTSLTTLIDVIGPIDVYSDYAFSTFQKGINTLDSKQALTFARERYSFSEGDRQRGRNQQHIIEAIIAKLSHTENAVKLPQITDTIKNAIETDMSEDTVKSIIYNQLNDIRRWNVESISVDGAGAMLPTYSYSATPLYVMVPSDESVANAKAKIANYLRQ